MIRKFKNNKNGDNDDDEDDDEMGDENGNVKNSFAQKQRIRAKQEQSFLRMANRSNVQESIRLEQLEFTRGETDYENNVW
eukprot:CAMPEP_0114340644 /NCGR_PEP_ID=MMETSP0101-20121206/8506_1 /TAXON_ID=38822 ORGANISM="Pteridomonas danica, Strain PT" /NCGR_SAMPLE_ID=MMETSP0101 /ASSEMBLY_ACC=CAM_ASM_000211 /LENGTH=79 /DNA_ID=CAMNT_0001473959 /DNA_START=230 /DNA_END=466 /DNA_ORIENTATION=+